MVPSEWTSHDFVCDSMCIWFCTTLWISFRVCNGTDIIYDFVAGIIKLWQLYNINFVSTHKVKLLHLSGCQPDIKQKDSLYSIWSTITLPLRFRKTRAEAGTTSCYSSNLTANKGKNKTTSLSAGLRKFMSRCEIKKNWKRRSRRRGSRGRRRRRVNPMNRLAPQSCLGTLPVEKTIQPVLISSWSFITTTEEPV